MMDAYKSWVRRNRSMISSFDSLASGLTWFLPDRFADSELTPECVSTTLGLLKTVNQHIIETTPHPRGPGLGGHQMARPGPGDDESFPWSLCVSVMKEVELLTEMAADHYLGTDKKWGPVASVEAIKVLVRLIILQKSGYKMLIDGGESKNIADTVPEGSEGRPMQNGRPVQNDVALPRRTNREASNPGSYPRDLEGRAMQAMHKFSENMVGPSRPSWLIQQQIHNTRPVPPSPVSRRFIAGEVLLIARPLLYVLAIWRYGLKSWRPWVAALSLDLVGMYLVSSSTSLPPKIMGNVQQGAQRLANAQQGSCVSLSENEVLELRKRQMRWALYVMRNPFFNRYTRHPLEALEERLSPIPLVGVLAGKAVELLVAVQGFYSYTAAS